MMNYRFEFNNISLKKKGNVNFQNVHLENLALSQSITSEKKKDVNKLLKKMFEDSWTSDRNDQHFNWY